jgi:hypothetical protein
VAVVAAALLEAQGPEADVQLVVHDDDPLRRDLEPVAQARDRPAREVHVGLGLAEDSGLAREPTLDDVCPALVAEKRPPARSASRSTTMKPTLCRFPA